MKKNRNVSKQDQSKILIAIIDGEQGKMVERYLKDTEDLDPYELKKLLQNVCDGILSEYRRDMLLGYARVQNLNIAHVPV